MKEINAKHLEPLQLVGYSETWYCGNYEFPKHRGIKISEKEIEHVTNISRLNGLQIGDRYKGNLKWENSPFVGDQHHTDAYLLTPSFVVISEHKKEEKDPKDFYSPKLVVTIFSQLKEDLRETAEKLKLPLEKLVESEE